MLPCVRQRPAQPTFHPLCVDAQMADVPVLSTELLKVPLIAFTY